MKIIDLLNKMANREEEIIRLCHYTNLQLLKAKDNLRKNAKLDYELLNESEMK